MIADEVIEQIAAANDVVDVIGSYLPLKRAGAIYKALCPFHQERTPSFNVNPARQTFKCFGCGVGGTVFKFIELYENVNFPEAAKRLAARAGIPLRDEPLSPEEDANRRIARRLLALHADTAEWFHLNLFRTRGAQNARDYLKSRGITAEVARDWQLGYAPDSWDSLTTWASEKGYTPKELLVSGLAGSREGSDHIYDRFRNRLMFPICNDIGNVIAFSGRVLNPADLERSGKYVNSPETPIFTKGKVLFGLHKSKRAIIDASCAIICEGQLDAMAVYEAGVSHVVASQGTAFTPQHAHLLRRFCGTSGEVVLCYDSDAAGLKAAERCLPALLNVGLSVRMAEMPRGEDPDSFIRAHGADAFRERIAAAGDFFDYQLERLIRTPEYGTAQGKAATARKLAESVSLIIEPILRQSVARNIASRLEIAPDQFLRLLTSAKPPTYAPAPRENADPQPQQAIAPLVLTPTTRLLCQLLLLYPAAREWLAAQPHGPVLSTLAEGELPTLLLCGSYQPGEAASLAAFLSALDPARQDLLAGLLDLPVPSGDPLATTRDCWVHLQRQSLTQRRDALTARLRQPGLSEEEVLRLQKQVLDLTRELTHITRPLSS